MNEVLVALLVFSMGLLGIAGMQLNALKETEFAYLRSIAIVQLTSMSQRLIANRTLSSRQREFKIWNKQNQTLLPKGKGSFVCHEKSCLVTIEWVRSGKHIAHQRVYIH